MVWEKGDFRGLVCAILAQLPMYESVKQVPEDIRDNGGDFYWEGIKDMEFIEMVMRIFSSFNPHGMFMSNCQKCGCQVVKLGLDHTFVASCKIYHILNVNIPKTVPCSCLDMVDNGYFLSIETAQYVIFKINDVCIENIYDFDAKRAYLAIGGCDDILQKIIVISYGVFIEYQRVGFFGKKHPWFYGTNKPNYRVLCRDEIYVVYMSNQAVKQV